MNEAIAGVQCADSYTDALTLGPLPATNVDGADVTIRGAGVLAQIFRKSLQGEQAQDDREYLFLPGSRHLANVAGVRFRNQIAGVPALVTASLTGPDIPLIGPVFADIPNVGAPLFITKQTVITNGAGDLFSGVPPSGYSALLLYAKNSSGNPIDVGVQNELPALTPLSSPLIARENVHLLSGQSVYWVVAVPASTVTVGFQNGLAVGNQTVALGVWPTNLPPGTYLPPLVNTSINVFTPSAVLYHADGASFANGVTTAELIAPFTGPVKIVNAAAAPNTVNLLIQLLDAGSVRYGFEVAIPLSAIGVTDAFLIPGHHQLEVVNGSGVAQTLNFSVIGQYGGLS